MTAVVYRFRDASGRLLYVGSTGSLSRRLSEHQRTKAWYGEIAAVEVAHWPNRDAAFAAEEIAIRDECPRYNIVHNRSGEYVTPEDRRRSALYAERSRLMELRDELDENIVFKSKMIGIYLDGWEEWDTPFVEWLMDSQDRLRTLRGQLNSRNKTIGKELKLVAA